MRDRVLVEALARQRRTNLDEELNLEEISERDKVLETLLLGLELNEQVNVAVWSRGVAPHRAE